MVSAALTVSIATDAQAGTLEKEGSTPAVTGTTGTETPKPKQPVDKPPRHGGGYDSGSGNGYDPGGPGSNGGYLGDPNHPGHEQF
jgi:hypothetical protein